MAELTGTWLGTYWQQGQPTRFELVLVQGGTALSGSVLDDGYLGEAVVSGVIVGLTVRFTKRYLMTSNEPVRYSGTVDDTGEWMRGQWYLMLESGAWEAHRTADSLLSELNRNLARVQSRSGQDLPPTAL